MHHFGLDVILDTNLRSWLLEVNYSPHMRKEDPATSQLVADMVDLALHENLLDQDSCWQVSAAASKGYRGVTGVEYHWHPPPAAERGSWDELNLEAAIELDNALR